MSSVHFKTDLSLKTDTLNTVVFKNTCVHCSKPFIEESIVVCVGAPHHILLHKNCAIYYNYLKGYSWSQPYYYYDFNSNNV